MNKYALGTIVGTALLGFAKKNTKGSNVKIKEVCNIEGYIDFQVNLHLNLVQLFHPKYENVVALTEKVWDRLPKTKIEEEPSEQQSSEQQSSEQQSSEQQEPFTGAPRYTYTKEGDGRYRILWCDLLLTLQHVIGERIEEIIHNNPDFNYPQGWDEDSHSWSVQTDMMPLWSEEPEGFNEFVQEEKAYFYISFKVDQTLENQPLPTEEMALDSLDNLVGELWDQIWDATFPIIKEEFFVSRMIADFTNWESDIAFDKSLVMERSGKWVPYQKPKYRSNLRKK